MTKQKQRDHNTVVLCHWRSEEAQRRLLAFFWATPGMETQQADALTAAVARKALGGQLSVQQRKALSLLPDASLASLESKLFNNAHAVTWIPVPLREDDNLGEVRKKVASALDVQDEKQIYMWFDDRSHPKSRKKEAGPVVVSQEIAAQAMKEKDMISRAELLSCILKLCGDKKTRGRISEKYLSSKTARNDVLTAWQAVNFTYGIISEFAATYSVCRPLDFRYAVDGHEVIICANPISDISIDANLVMGDGTPRHVYSLVSLDGITLEATCGGSLEQLTSGNYALNVCTAYDVMKWVRSTVHPWRPDRERLYFNGYVHQFFPFMPDFTGMGELRLEQSKPTPVHALAPLIARENVLREWERLAATVTDKQIATFDETAWSYAQVRSNEVNSNRHVDLSDVFNIFHVSQSVPLTIFYDGTSTIYKLYTPDVISKKVPESKVSSWIQKKPQQKSDEPYMQFIVKMQIVEGITSYGKIIIWPDLAYEIRQNFPLISGSSDKEFQLSMDQINDAVIKPLRHLLSGRPLRFPSPDLSLTHTQHMSFNHLSSRINNAVVTAFLRSRTHRIPSLKAMATMARQEMASLLDVVHLSPSMLLLRMRRVDAMARLQTIDGVIRGMQEEPTEAIVAHLMDAFGMSHEEAERQVNDWTTDYSMNLELGHASAFGRGKGAKDAQDLLLPAAARGGATHRGGAVIVRILPPAKNTGSKVIIEGISNTHCVLRIQRTLLALVAAAGGWVKRDANSTRSRDDTSSTWTDDNTDMTSAGDLDLEEVQQQLESELTSLLSGRENAADGNSIRQTETSEDELGDEEEDSGNANKMILNKLYQADPELFKIKLSNGSRYSSVCGKVDARQPIVISAEDKANIDKVSPGSYNGYVRAGSSLERAERNYFICPDVWCPKSRVSMTMAQFKKQGEKCPSPAVEETPIVLQAKYWESRQKYPGFLESRHHPDGLCMPCCFRKPQHKVKECTIANPALVASDVTDKNNTSAAMTVEAEAPSDEASNRYIRSNVLPLGKDMFGLLPAEAHAFFGNRKCGNRDDGSGQIISQTNCFVRRGIENTSQPFLSAVAHVLGVNGGYKEVSQKMLAEVDMHAFLQLSEGATAKELMPALPDIGNHAKLSAFASWLPMQGDYLKQFGLQDIVQLVKSQRKTLMALVSTNAAVCREYVLYDALSKFKSILSDERYVKTHASGLLDLLNLPSKALNPDGINFVVIEGDVHTSSVYAHVSATSRQRMALDRPFAFLVKQGPYYEPLCRIQTKKGDIAADVLISYDSSAAVRSVVDSIRVEPSSKTAQEGVGWGGMLQLLSFLEENVIGQIVDYKFTAIGLITSSLVAVPLQAPCAVLPDRKLQIMYASDVHKLRPKAPVNAIQSMFQRLSALVEDDGFMVQEIVQGKKKEVSHITLRCGFVVPINMSLQSLPLGHYLENLNIVVGLQKHDSRTSFSSYLRRTRENTDRQIRQILSLLQTRSDYMQEYLFLRSSHNPFPLEYRRVRMFNLATQILELQQHHQTGNQLHAPLVENAKVIDRLLYGPDILQDNKGGISVSVHPAPQKPSEFMVVTDTELLQGTLESVLNQNMVAVNKQRSTLKSTALPSNDATISEARSSASSERMVLSMIREDVQAPGAVPRGVSMRLRRDALSVLHGVNVFTLISLINKIFNAASDLKPSQVKKLVENRVIRDIKSHNALPKDLVEHTTLGSKAKRKMEVGECLRKMESQRYAPDIYDVRILSEACRINIIMVDIRSGAKVYSFFGSAASDQCVLLFRHAQGFDAVFGKSKSHYLTFSRSTDVPGILSNIKEAVKKEVRGT